MLREMHTHTHTHNNEQIVIFYFQDTNIDLYCPEVTVTLVVLYYNIVCVMYYLHSAKMEIHLQLIH